VATALLSDDARGPFLTGVRAEYDQLRARRLERQSVVRRQSIADARANKLVLDLSSPPPKPSFTGVRTYDDVPLTDLLPRIDWTPFFQTWELDGSYPAILDDPVVGETARSLFTDARAMLRRLVDERWVHARAVVGFFPANSDGADDIRVWSPDRRQNTTAPLAVVHTIRQQMVKTDGAPNLALADFVAPDGSGVDDWMGFFAVTTGIGLEEKVAEFEACQDDYSAIMIKALADRLAEAFAERMHERVRHELWGYAAGEHLDNRSLIREDYQGIRPAPGYPACPDHTEKAALFALLNVTERAGIGLTESFAMVPTAAVSGYYFWRPEARYFGVGKIERDQVDDYSRRKGQDLATTERWLAPILNYDR
jgi:5-methyltetrahydrofolate--homocysteine methyltransferase